VVVRGMKAGGKKEVEGRELLEWIELSTTTNAYVLNSGRG
jgi:hypothetical protein